ncbi:MAG: T9SS type A sorting domain-containing protein [Bacteroidota bacterium]|jgi:hypothetical protein
MKKGTNISLLIFVAAVVSSLNAQPTIITMVPDSVTATSAVLRGRCNPHGSDVTVHFEIGPTTYYGLSYLTTPVHIGAGSQDIIVRQLILGLSPTTTYHVRTSAYIGNNNSAGGGDLVFLTTPDSESVGFAVPLLLKDTTGRPIAPAALFGVHSFATYCLDPNLGEHELPPPPPGGMSQIKFDDPRGTGCFGGGTLNDYRPYVSSSQVDSYLVEISPGSSGYPLRISWPPLSPYYADSVNLVDAYTGTLVNVDMKSQDSIVITRHLNLFYIIAKGPVGMVSVWADSITDVSFALSGRFNPSGLSTEAWFEWGTTPDYGSSSPVISIGNRSSPVIYHSKVSHLLPYQPYYYRTLVRNSNGLISSVGGMVTTPIGTDTVLSPVIYNTQGWATGKDSATVIAYFETNGSDTYVWFEWGTTSSYGDSSLPQFGGEGWLATAFLATIRGLIPGTTYHFRAVARNAGGTTFGPDQTFTTYAAMRAPKAVTLPADSITSNSAILQAIVNPLGSKVLVQLVYSDSMFVFGSVNTVLMPDSVDVPVRLSVTGLAPHTKYTYRVEASVDDALGVYTNGDYEEFTTLFDSTYGGFKIPLTMINNASISTTLWFGVHNHATNCLDPMLGEYLLPPLPPSSAMDFRFVDPRSPASGCYDQGVLKDLRPYLYSSQVDTFRVHMQAGNGGYPVILKWKDVSAHYSDSVKLFDELGGVVVNVDMKARDSAVITLPLSTVLMTAKGPVNIVYAKMAIANDTSALLAGAFNPNGTSTQAWFEWGSDSTYGRTTAVADIGNSRLSQRFSSVINNLTGHTAYHFRPVVQNTCGTFYGLDQSFTTSAVLSAPPAREMPHRFALAQSYPNPFNPATTIHYELPREAFVTLKIYDILGKEVATLVNTQQPAGYYNAIWNAENLPSAVYFYRLQAGNPSASSGHGFTDIKKMLLLK